jgi:hypothetical protein
METKKYKIIIDDIDIEDSFLATIQEYDKDNDRYEDIDYVDVYIDKKYFEDLNEKYSKLFFGSKNETDIWEYFKNYYIGDLLDFILNNPDYDYINKENIKIEFKSGNKLSLNEALEWAQNYKNSIKNLELKIKQKELEVIKKGGNKHGKTK